jgi:hypothetical protein
LASEGVTEHPRVVGGQGCGAWHVYSALNLRAALTSAELCALTLNAATMPRE